MNGDIGKSRDELSAWIGREDRITDVIDLKTARSLAATLDYGPADLHAGDALPPLWHWVYFTAGARQSELGPDGHPTRGGFIPPVDLPNRMWAGGRFRFHQPLRLGEQAERRSRIIRCERKRGRSGDLVFVTVAHSISGTSGVALEEEHDIVYRQRAPANRPVDGEQPTLLAEFRKRVLPDAVLLFRYSALTFNGHRIHYDHPYATGQEGYPGLVVHGPLTATLLLEAFRREYPEKRILIFNYQAVGPLFDSIAFDVCGRITQPGQADLWTDCGSRLTMRATLVFTD